MYNFRRLFDHPGWLSFAVLIALHYASIQLSFFCGKTPDNEVIIWLPNSVLLIAILRMRLSLGLLMALITFASNTVANLPSATLNEALLLSSVNLAEIGITVLIMRLTDCSPSLCRLKDFSNFFVAGPLIGCFVSGLLGAAVISAYGSSASYLTLMRVWWFDDGLGLLIFAPMLMLASDVYDQNPKWRLIDMAMLLIIVAIIASMYFTLQAGQGTNPLSPTLIIPFALLLALRFEMLWVSIGVALIALLISRMVALGLNPFADTDMHHPIIRTQEFILTISIICMGSSIFRRQLLINERGLEQKVQERTAELAANLVQLKNMQAELVQSAKLASLGSLVAGVAHELNTPIGIVVMATSTLREHVRELLDLVNQQKLKRSELEQFTGYLVEESYLIERNINRAADLVDAFKKIAVGQTGEKRSSFDLLQDVTECLMPLLPLISQRGYDLHVDIPEPIHMDSYPGQLEQVIAALTNNALLHAFAGREHGRILIRARQEGNQVRLEFIDDGAGMNDRVATRIFVPFFTTRMGTGSGGLGMFIVNNIVTGVLGGSISFKTGPMQGAHFQIVLPLCAPIA